MTIPNIEITNVNRYKISDEQESNQCIVTFKVSNTDIKRFEIRASKDTTYVGRGKGLLVEQDNTLYPSISLFPRDDLYPYEYHLVVNEPEEAIINFNELSNGDGTYLISIYALSTDGDWNE